MRPSSPEGAGPGKPNCAVLKRYVNRPARLPATVARGSEAVPFLGDHIAHNAITRRAPSATRAANATISAAMSSPVARSRPSNPGLEFNSTTFGPSLDSSPGFEGLERATGLDIAA